MWSKEQDKYLIANYPTEDINVMMEILGRSKPAIMSRAVCKFGVRKSQRRKMPNSWTEEKELYLENNYATKTIVSMAKVLGYSPSGVSKKLESMGLKKFRSTNKDKLSNNKHFTQCLTPTQSSRMAVFLTMLSDIKRSSINAGKQVKIDMIELVESYRLVVG